MKKVANKKWKILAIVLACVIVALGCVGIGIWEFGKDVYYANKEGNIAYQKAHMEYLKNEFYVDYVPKGEQTFCNFDLQQALNNGVKYNEVTFLATHNSYQRLITEETKKFQIPFQVLSLGIVNVIFNKNTFENDTLTNQFENGIRSIELDIEAREMDGEVSFTVTHKPMLDSATTCYDFATALEEIVEWSNHNPNHLPISIIVEPKQDVPNVDGLKIFGIEHVDEFDVILREKLADKLLTPNDMLRSHATFKDMRESDDWMQLKDMLGKIVVILHENPMTEGYVAIDETLRTQAMIPSLEYDQRNASYASIIIDNEPKNTVEMRDELQGNNFYVRTRADHYPKSSEERYDLVEKCGSQIITSDYGPRTVRLDEHLYSFDGYTVKLS